MAVIPGRSLTTDAEKMFPELISAVAFWLPNLLKEYMFSSYVCRKNQGNVYSEALFFRSWNFS